MSGTRPQDKEGGLWEQRFREGKIDYKQQERDSSVKKGISNVKEKKELSEETDEI